MSKAYIYNDDKETKSLEAKSTPSSKEAPTANVLQIHNQMPDNIIKNILNAQLLHLVTSQIAIIVQFLYYS